MSSRLVGRRPIPSEAVTVRWLLAGQLIAFIGIAAPFPIAPLYVRDHGGGPVAAAIFVASALLSSTLVQIPVGRLVDHVGRRRILLWSRVGFGVLGIALFAADAAPLWVLVLLRTLMGAASGAYVPALLATLTDLTPPDRRAERFSQLQAAEMVGLLAGPLLGGVVALWRNSAVFLVTGVAALAGVLAQRQVPETLAHRTRAEGPPPLPRGWRRRRGVLVPLAGLIAVGSAFSMYDVVWPQFLDARGASTVLIGISISLFAVPMLILATPGGRLSDRSDRRVVLGICLAIVASCCATYPLLRSIPVILILGTVEAIGFVMCEPSLYATIGDAAPADGRGRAMALGGTAQLAGAAFGSAALGSLYAVREGLPFWSASAGLVLAGVLCAVALPPGPRSRDRRPEATRSATSAEPGGPMVVCLDDRDDAARADVHRAALAGQLHELDAVLADAERRDGVGNADPDQDVATVLQAE